MLTCPEGLDEAEISFQEVTWRLNKCEYCNTMLVSEEGKRGGTRGSVRPRAAMLQAM